MPRCPERRGIVMSGGRRFGLHFVGATGVYVEPSATPLWGLRSSRVGLPHCWWGKGGRRVSVAIYPVAGHDPNTMPGATHFAPGHHHAEVGPGCRKGA